MTEKPSALPVLMRRSDIITLRVAMARAGKSDRTIRDWCKRYGIGRQSQPGAPLEISGPGLEMVLHGDLAALEMLRAGMRDAPAVQRFFRHLGMAA